MTIMGASPPVGAKDGESTIMDGSWAAANGESPMSAEAGVGGPAASGLKVALGSGLLGTDAPPSRGSVSLVRVGGGTARASLNLELFWESGADFVGAEDAGALGSVVTEAAAAAAAAAGAGGGCLGVGGAP
jgi:hypothetical protein